MANATQLPEQLIYLIIRFTASLPDLPLSISSPGTITTLSLKQLVRKNLPPNHALARLRLIYAGKVLADAEPLSTSLKLPPPGSSRRNGTRKGKQSSEWTGEANKRYIHCSLGDPLSLEELASEATLAQSTEASLKQHYAGSSSSTNHDRRRSSTAPKPQAQGFDRLLASGFTAQEVASLRSHFQTNLSFTHTPDTMPSPAEMRVLEDRWLDSTATDPSPALTGEGGDTGWGAGFAVEEGGLDDMLWGYMTGFFWPLGALVWGFREEGVWSRRRQLAVVMGVLINIIFGFMRWSS
ncbi:DUF2407 C-terminal domain-containing protein [Phaeosphaeriaceae sp. PMI808]|nr:DUF2407 C-terminal domain-containing protein [Phaeosphaeriaceae sp. PMI808]